jgi:hypothetical protein
MWMHYKKCVHVLLFNLVVVVDVRCLFWFLACFGDPNLSLATFKFFKTHSSGCEKALFILVQIGGSDVLLYIHFYPYIRRKRKAI